MTQGFAGSVARQSQIRGDGAQLNVVKQVNWPDFTFPPINLFSYPKQKQDYSMSEIEEMGLGVRTAWTPKDIINKPAHYTHGGIETWDVIEAWKLNYNLGNVVKYISRADHKGKRLEDLQKSRAYLDREICLELQKQ